MTTTDSQETTAFGTVNAHKWNSVSASELKQQATQAPPELVPGLIPSRGVVVFAGAPGIGKSLTALSWASAVASGTSWLGRPASNPMRVVYVLGEGWSRFGHRVEAWEQANGQTVPEWLHFINGAAAGIDLLDPNDIDAAVEVFSNMNPAPALVIFDTFAMLAGVKNENDNAEVGRVMAGAHRIVEATGATVMLIHHLSKVEGQVRGATSLRGNADTVVVAAPDKEDKGETFWLSTHTSDDGKQRDGEPVKLRGFKIISPGVLTHSDAVAEHSEARAGIVAAMAQRSRTLAAVDGCEMNCDREAVNVVSTNGDVEGMSMRLCAEHTDEMVADCKRAGYSCSVRDLKGEAA